MRRTQTNWRELDTESLLLGRDARKTAPDERLLIAAGEPAEDTVHLVADLILAHALGAAGKDGEPGTVPYISLIPAKNGMVGWQFNSERNLEHSGRFFENPGDHPSGISLAQTAIPIGAIGHTTRRSLDPTSKGRIQIGRVTGRPTDMPPSANIGLSTQDAGWLSRQTAELDLWGGLLQRKEGANGQIWVARFPLTQGLPEEGPEGKSMSFPTTQLHLMPGVNVSNHMAQAERAAVEAELNAWKRLKIKIGLASDPRSNLVWNTQNGLQRIRP